MKNMIPFVSLLLAVSACTGIPENKKNALPQDVERLSGEVRDRFLPDKRVIRTSNPMYAPYSRKDDYRKGGNYFAGS